MKTTPFTEFSKSKGCGKKSIEYAIKRVYQQRSGIQTVRNYEFFTMVHSGKSKTRILQRKCVALLGLVAITGIVYFIVVVSVLHFLRPDYNPVNHAVSNYAVGSFGYLMTSAFYVLAVSVIALAADLFFSIALNKASRVAISLLCLSSCGIAVMGVFPGDAHALHPPATITGVIHWAAAAFSFLSIMITAFLLAFSFKTDERFQRFQKLCLVLAMAMVAALWLY